MARYVPDHREFGKLMRSQMIRALMARRGRDAATELAAIAPARTGRYKASVRVETGLALRKDRIAAFVIADVAYAAALEVGSDTITRPPAPMTRLLTRMRV